jgi:L-cysteate sulfo-lyase
VKREDATGLVVGTSVAVPGIRIAGIDIDAGPWRVRSDVIAYAKAAADFIAP